MAAWFLAAILLVTPGDGWSNLKHVTRDRLYAVVLRDGECQYGTLYSVGEQAVILETASGLSVLIKRSQIMRVSDNLTAPGRAVVFSARSSWLDVKTAEPKGTEYLAIITKRGAEWKWKQPAVSDQSIAFDSTSINKADVRAVSFVRSKPIAISEEYQHEADFKWLASLPLVGKVLDGKISVLLYDAGQPEDNSPLACRLQALTSVHSSLP